PPARAPDLDNLPPLIALLDCLSESFILQVGEEAALRRRRMMEFATVLGELVIALFLAIPIVNLLTPLFAAGMMVHLHKLVSAKDPGLRA
ncbi:hypothetical protein ACC763_38070, partial [Rhizobium ruizarguesonis]